MLAAFVPVLALVAGAAAPAAPEHFALVVTNNRSLDPSRPDLHYADDDGVKWAQLFSESFGRDHVTLLTTLDAETAALYPAWTEGTRAPTRDALDQALSQLATRLDGAKAQQRTTEVHLVFAGHGDVAQGQGYVELDGSRLTARDLDEHVIARLPADRVHLVLDSCNSYFMLNPRKPGGKRWSAPLDDSQSLLKHHPHVGALISTSAEAVTYEWSELQSGIFSYEVRSGLRGAADADGDGRVTYPEIAAFLQVANEPVPNELYRPKVFAHGPSQQTDGALWNLPRDGARTLRIRADRPRRLTIRDARGVRVADLHAEAGPSTSLVLPAEELVAQELVAPAGSDTRPTERESQIPLGNELDLDRLAERPAALASRGDAPVFKELFTTPFGPQAFARVQAAETHAPPPVPFSVSTRDLDRLQLHLDMLAEVGAHERLALGGVMLGTTLLSSAMVFTSITRSTQTLQTGDYVSASLLMAAPLAIAALTLGWHSPEERLRDDFLKLDLSTEGRRTDAVLATERRFREAAEDAKSSRHVLNWVRLGLGAAMLAGGGYLLSHANPDDRFYGSLVVAGGLFGTGVGLYGAITDLPSAMERSWQLYDREANASEHLADGGEQQPAVTLRPGVLSLSGTF